MHQQAIDTTSAAGKMFFHILGAFAEFEREMIRTRVKAGLERQAQMAARPPRKDPRANAHGRGPGARRVHASVTLP
ncbi:MAG: recombinase family protein, partial [Acetobacteraceae bacterium]|nr:recombinase family protein [Acetobacteraceae bacterium]